MRTPILTEGQKRYAYDLWCCGFTFAEIGDALKVDGTTVHRAIDGRPKIKPKIAPYSEVREYYEGFADGYDLWAEIARKGVCKVKRTERICLVCGKMFTPNAQYKKYCSHECQLVGEERRDRQYNFDRHKRDYEIAHPGEVYEPRKRKGNPGKKKEPVKKTFGDKLVELKSEGKDYVEEQKKKTIERYARIIL